jgi:hypothetical protein
LISTDISLQMADKSTTIPIGICEDVPVQVANNYLILLTLLCSKCLKMIIRLLFLGDLFLTLQVRISISAHGSKLTHYRKTYFKMSKNSE